MRSGRIYSQVIVRTIGLAYIKANLYTHSHKWKRMNMVLQAKKDCFNAFHYCWCAFCQYLWLSSVHYRRLAAMHTILLFSLSENDSKIHCLTSTSDSVEICLHYHCSATPNDKKHNVDQWKKAPATKKTAHTTKLWALATNDDHEINLRLYFNDSRTTRTRLNKLSTPPSRPFISPHLRAGRPNKQTSS